MADDRSPAKVDAPLAQLEALVRDKELAVALLKSFFERSNRERIKTDASAAEFANPTFELPGGDAPSAILRFVDQSAHLHGRCSALARSIAVASDPPASARATLKSASGAL